MLQHTAFFPAEQQLEHVVVRQALPWDCVQWPQLASRPACVDPRARAALPYSQRRLRVRIQPLWTESARWMGLALWQRTLAAENPEGQKGCRGSTGPGWGQLW